MPVFVPARIDANGCFRMPADIRMEPGAGPDGEPGVVVLDEYGIVMFFRGNEIPQLLSDTEAATQGDAPRNRQLLRDAYDQLVMGGMRITME